jgi:hypothetical protein
MCPPPPLSFIKSANNTGRRVQIMILLSVYFSRFLFLLSQAQMFFSILTSRAPLICILPPERQMTSTEIKELQVVVQKSFHLPYLVTDGMIWFYPCKKKNPFLDCIFWVNFPDSSSSPYISSPKVHNWLRGNLCGGSIRTILILFFMGTLYP